MYNDNVHISKTTLNTSHGDRVDYKDYILSYNNTPLTRLDMYPSQILDSRRLRTLVRTNNKLLEPQGEKGIYKLLLLRQSCNIDTKYVTK